MRIKQQHEASLSRLIRNHILAAPSCCHVSRTCRVLSGKKEEKKRQVNNCHKLNGSRSAAAVDHNGKFHPDSSARHRWSVWDPSFTPRLTMSPRSGRAAVKRTAGKHLRSTGVQASRTMIVNVETPWTMKDLHFHRSEGMRNILFGFWIIRVNKLL